MNELGILLFGLDSESYSNLMNSLQSDSCPCWIQSYSKLMNSFPSDSYCSLEKYGLLGVHQYLST